MKLSQQNWLNDVEEGDDSERCVVYLSICFQRLRKTTEPSVKIPGLGVHNRTDYLPNGKQKLSSSPSSSTRVELISPFRPQPPSSWPSWITSSYKFII
jgi:hypothetical protein